MEHGLAQHHLGPGHRTRAWRGPPAGSNQATVVSVVSVDGEDGFGDSTALINESHGLGETSSRSHVWVNLPPLAGPDRHGCSGPSAGSSSASTSTSTLAMPLALALVIAARKHRRCSHYVNGPD